MRPQDSSGHRELPLLQAMVFCCLAAAFLVSAQVSVLNAIPADDAPILRFSPRAGQTLIYNLSSRMDSEGQSFLGKTLTLSALADGEIDVLIKQTSKEAVFAELVSPGIRIFLRTPGGQDEFTLNNTPDSPVQVVFDRTSRIREVKNTEGLEKQNPMNFSILEVLRTYWPALPDGPVAVGESWKDYKRLDIPFQEMSLIIELEMTYTLDGIVPAPEGRLALISVAYTAGVSGERELEEFKGAFEGRGNGSGNLYFQVESGYFSEYRLDYVINGAMVIRKAEAKVVEWPFKLSADASLVLLEWR